MRPWPLGLGCGKRALILLQEHNVTMGKTLLVKQNRLYIKPNFADCLLDLPNWIVSVHCPIYWFIGKLFPPFFELFFSSSFFFLNTNKLNGEKAKKRSQLLKPCVSVKPKGPLVKDCPWPWHLWIMGWNPKAWGKYVHS